MKTTNNSIVCVINPSLMIRLENCREVYGHDDSLPFNADVFVFDSEDEFPCFHRIATAYNDGWGGPTNINTLHQKYISQLNKIEQYIKDHYEIVCKNGIRWDVNLEYLVSIMAYYCIDLGIKSFNIKKLEDCKEKQK